MLDFDVAKGITQNYRDESILNPLRFQDPLDGSPQ